MCIQTVITASGIPVRYDDKKEPLFSGLRKRLGLEVQKGQEEETPPPLTPRPIAFIKKASPAVSTDCSATVCKMGSKSPRTLIRGY